MKGLRGETYSLRAGAELLGPTKALGCEEAKQILGIYKQAHRHLRSPRVPLQAPASLEASGYNC